MTKESVLKMARWSAILILGLAFVSKVYEFTNPSKYFLLPDPVLSGLTIKQSLAFGIAVEGFSVVVLWVGSRRIAALLCLWLAVSFTAYHLLSAINSPGMKCPCFGYFLDSTSIPRQALDWAAYTSILAIALAGIVLLCLGQGAKDSVPDGAPLPSS